MHGNKVVWMAHGRDLSIHATAITLSPCFLFDPTLFGSYTFEFVASLIDYKMMHRLLLEDCELRVVFRMLQVVDSSQ